MFTNNSNIEMPLAVWLASTIGYDLTFNPQIVSATTLLNPIKSIVLSRQMGMAAEESDHLDISDAVPAKVGSAVHTAVEVAWKDDYTEALLKLGYKQVIVDRIIINPQPEELLEDSIPVYIEKRSSMQVGTFEVSGKFDFVVAGRVEDIKTTKTFNWISGSNRGRYIKQGSIYRLLNQDIIVDDVMAVHYVFTDWSPLQAQANKDYPQHRIITEVMPLMTLQQTQDFVEERIEDIEKYMDVPQKHMPQCTPKELWQNPSKWAFYKDPNKTTRATRLFDLSSDAYTALQENNGVGVVVERKAVPKFCDYCNARPICEQAANFVTEGLLK